MGEIIYIEGQFPISEAAFANLLQILQVMKPGLVRAEPADTKVWPDMTDGAS